MKKSISLKLFFTVLWRGFCQVLRAIGHLFGYKDESTYGKVVWRIFVGCTTVLVVLFTGCVLYSFTTEVVIPKWIYPKMFSDSWDERYISNYLAFQSSWRNHEGRVYDKRLKKIVLDDVDWIVVSDDRDSLAVFARKNKRGYINRFTGDIAIPETYSRAWIFSEGLAAVEKDNELLFIDHSGKTVIDNDLQVHFDNPRYAFKNGYCLVKDPVTSKMGLIDRKGNWALNPEYDNLFNNEGFWQVEKDGYVGLFKPDLQPMFPIANTCISISDNIIEVRLADHTAKCYDYEGNVVVDFVIDEISNLQYETDLLRNTVDQSADIDSHNKIYAVANRQQYKVSGGWSRPDYYGLISRDGKRITQPIYTLIEAVGKDLYLCHPQGVLIDGNGEIVNKTR